MPKFKLFISYDGTNYSGWQVQPNAASIQMIIQNALAIILREKVSLIGSGRTDAGVHALEQIAHFSYEKEIDLSRLCYSLNAILPADIRIHKIENAHSSFHARYSALGKIYHYHLHLDRQVDPFKRLYSLHVLKKIDLSLLAEAKEAFVGEHDFTSFANEAHKGSASRNPVRTINRLDLVEEKGGARLEFEADGFLYKMVRNIVGTLIEVSAKKILLSEIPEIFAAKDRRRAAKAAAAHGLFLMKVHYPEFYPETQSEGHSLSSLSLAEDE